MAFMNPMRQNFSEINVIRQVPSFSKNEIKINFDVKIAGNNF